MLDCHVQLYLLGYRVTLLNIGDNLLGDRPLLQVRWQLFSAHATSGQEHLRNVQVWHDCRVFRPPSLLNRQILFTISFLGVMLALLTRMALAPALTQLNRVCRHKPTTSNTK